MSLLRPALIILVPIAALGAIVAVLHAPGHAAALHPADAAGVIHLNAAGFPALKAQAKPVLIDFWAPWCGPCRQQGPIVEQVSAQMGDQAIVAKVNVDEERALAAQYDVRAIPTLVVLRDGNVVGRFVGVTDASTLAGALRSARP